MSLPSSERCNRRNRQVLPKKPSLLPILIRQATLLVAKRASRSLVPSNDWRWARLTLLLLISLVCLRPTSLQIVVFFMSIICFHLLPQFILILSSLGVNLILMQILVRLDVTLFLFHILAESVMSPPTMPNMVFAKRMCQLSLVQQPTLVNPVAKLLFLWSMRACGLVPGSHTHSSTRTNSNTMTSPCMTTPSIRNNPFPSNTLSLQSHSTLPEPSSFLILIHLPSMSLILAPTYT